VLIYTVMHERARYTSHPRQIVTASHGHIHSDKASTGGDWENVMGNAISDIHAGTDTQAIHGWLDRDYGLTSITIRGRFFGGGLRSMGGWTAAICRTGLSSASMSIAVGNRGTTGMA